MDILVKELRKCGVQKEVRSRVRCSVGYGSVGELESSSNWKTGENEK